MSIIDDLNALPDTDDAPEAGPGAAFSFKDLLAEAVLHKAEGEKLKAVRKTLKNGNILSAEEAADLRRMENAREWLPRAGVAMFQVQHCTSCENYSAMFTGLFQRQTSKQSPTVSRWVAASESENYGLSKEVKTTESDIPFCCFCLADHGFPGEQLGITFDDEPADGTSAPLTPQEEADLAEAQQLAFEAEQDAMAEQLQLSF